MVKITNGVNVFEVTRGAYDGIYSKQGYYNLDSTPVDEVEAAEETEVEEKVDDNELFVNNLLEKPISQWNKDEVKRFAELKSIDITGTKNAGEAKELIKEFLDQSNA